MYFIPRPPPPRRLQGILAGLTAPPSGSGFACEAKPRSRRRRDEPSSSQFKGFAFEPLSLCDSGLRRGWAGGNKIKALHLCKATL